MNLSKPMTEKIQAGKQYRVNELVKLGLLPFCTKTVRKMIAAKEIPATVVQRGKVTRVFVEGADLIAWWKRHGKA